MQGTGALSDLNKIDLVVDLHTEANFGVGCVPVGGSFVSCESNPVFPPSTLKVSLLFQSAELAVGRILLTMT